MATLDLSRLWNENVAIAVKEASVETSGTASLTEARDDKNDKNEQCKDDDGETAATSTPKAPKASNFKSRPSSTMAQSKHTRFVIQGQHNTHAINASNERPLGIGKEDAKRSTILAFRKQFQTSHTHKRPNNLTQNCDHEDLSPSLNASTLLGEVHSR